MDGLFGIIGILAVAFGVLFVGTGFWEGSEPAVIQGSALLGTGVVLLAISSVIGLLKEIRDAVKKPSAP